MKLSVLIPVYNERYHVGELVRRVLSAPLPEGMDREIIIVDDGSTDGTAEVVDLLAAEHPRLVRVLHQPENRGKGAAIRTAIAEATGDFTLFQDADLEYDPRDYPALLSPLLDGHADAVFGSRYLFKERRRVLYFWHSVGNRLLTTLSNVFSDLNLTDVAAGYKAFRTELLKTVPIRSDGFSLEAEITAKVARRGFRVYEVPIRYDGRSYLEGKKITWRDGVRAFFTILGTAGTGDIYEGSDTGPESLAGMALAQHFNRWMADVLRPYLGARVLEIGAGTGNLTVQLLPRDHYVASEVDERHLAFLQNLALRRVGLETARVDATRAEDFAPYAGKVDTIICLNVLEHIADPVRALQNFRDTLPSGGRAILLVPQGQWLYSDFDRDLGHVKRYSRAELVSEIEASGLALETVFEFNRPSVPGWYVNSTLLGRRHLAVRQLRAYDRMIWLARRVDGVLPWPGLSLIAVARKR